MIYKGGRGEFSFPSLFQFIKLNCDNQWGIQERVRYLCLWIFNSELNVMHSIFAPLGVQQPICQWIYSDNSDFFSALWRHEWHLLTTYVTSDAEVYTCEKLIRIHLFPSHPGQFHYNLTKDYRIPMSVSPAPSPVLVFLSPTIKAA